MISSLMLHKKYSQDKMNKYVSLLIVLGSLQILLETAVAQVNLAEVSDRDPYRFGGAGALVGAVSNQAGFPPRYPMVPPPPVYPWGSVSPPQAPGTIETIFRSVKNSLGRFIIFPILQIIWSIICYFCKDKYASYVPINTHG